MPQEKRKNNRYSIEFKKKAVEMYLSGEHGGINTLTKNLGLKSHTQIKQWIAKYKELGVKGLESQTGRTKGISIGRPRKKFLSPEEEIVRLRAENEYLKGIMDISNLKKKNNTS